MNSPALGRSPLDFLDGFAFGFHSLSFTRTHKNTHTQEDNERTTLINTREVLKNE